MDQDQRDRAQARGSVATEEATEQQFHEVEEEEEYGGDYYDGDDGVQQEEEDDGQAGATDEQETKAPDMASFTLEAMLNFFQQQAKTKAAVPEPASNLIYQGKTLDPSHYLKLHWSSWTSADLHNDFEKMKFGLERFTPVGEKKLIMKMMKDVYRARLQVISAIGTVNRARDVRSHNDKVLEMMQAMEKPLKG